MSAQPDPVTHPGSQPLDRDVQVSRDHDHRLRHTALHLKGSVGPVREPTTEGSRELQDANHLSVADHRKINSQAFHEKFSEKIAIHETGLVVDVNTGKFYGVSHFTNHSWAEVATYRRGVFPGRPGNLIKTMEKLPGVKAKWSDFPDKDRLLESLFSAKTHIESDLIDNLGDLTLKLREGISDAAEGIYRAKEVKLGAYGLLPFSICEENAFHSYSAVVGGKLPDVPPHFKGDYLYCPERVAVVGKCDVVYYYGKDSGHPPGTKPVAVVEAKIYSNKKKCHYHMRNNAILHQIWASLIGSEAPLGVVLANGRFKFFWVEEHDDKTYFFTFPAGNSLGDFSKTEDSRVFCEVMFHVVRCSLSFVESSREAMESDDDFKVVSEDESKSALAKRKAKEDERDAKRKDRQQVGNDSTDKHARKVGVFMDGSEFLFAPYDFSYWSEDELEVMDKQLDRDKKQLRERLEWEAEFAKKKAEKHLSSGQTAANTAEF